jgi:hypothetical protein
MLLNHFGEVTHNPAGIWYAVSGVGLATAVLLWLYDRTIKPSVAPVSD